MSRAPSGSTGTSRLCATLAELGVSHVFGLPGTQLVPLFESLRKSTLATVVPTHELAASFMAGAYFRACGRPAVLATIPGPGFTYAMTGLAEARLDSAALIHVTVAAPEDPLARFRLQAIRQRELGDAIAKATITVYREADVEDAVRRAHALAMDGQPGPVVLALSETPGDSPVRVTTTDEPVASIAQVSSIDVWRRLRDAERPLLYVGQGALHAARSVQLLAEALQAPVITTPSARGILPEDHPLVIPFDVCRGSVDAASQIMRQADLILVLGARLGHNGTAGGALPFPADRTVHIDAAADVCGQAYGTPGLVARIEEWFDAGSMRDLQVAGWSPSVIEQARAAARTSGAPQPEPVVAGTSAERFFAALRRVMPRDGMLVTDTGLHQVLARRHFEVFAPGGLLLPTDFQSMGFGLPAAIAAKVAAPRRPVAALIGDGGLAMTGLELATATQLGISLPVMVFVDGYFNQIRLHQQSDYGHDHGTTLPALDIAALAEATGAAFADGSSIDTVLADALRRSGPTLIAVPVGDSIPLRRIRQVRRAKEGLRSLVGSRLLDLFRGRGRGSP